MSELEYRIAYKAVQMFAETHPRPIEVNRSQAMITFVKISGARSRNRKVSIYAWFVKMCEIDNYLSCAFTHSIKLRH